MKKNKQLDYIKANRRGSREAEIQNHGKPVSFHRIEVSKKVYNRAKNKADAERQPYLYLIRPFYLLRITS